MTSQPPEDKGDDRLPWGKNMVANLMALKAPVDENEGFIKTPDPYMSAVSFRTIIRKLELGDVYSKTLQMPDHAIIGLQQFDGISKSRPAFFVERVSDKESILHADFEKVQFALTIRAHPEKEDFHQLDEFEIALAVTQGRKRSLRRVFLDCSNNAQSAPHLYMALKDFAELSAGIAQLRPDSHLARYAEHYAVFAAHEAINQHQRNTTSFKKSDPGPA